MVQRLLNFYFDWWLVSGEIIRRVEDEHVSLLQTILERCMRKESLLCELYLQLIKQTTDHPDPNSRVNLRHWALLSLSCSVVLPPNKVIRRYLIGHLKRYVLTTASQLTRFIYLDFQMQFRLCNGRGKVCKVCRKVSTKNAKHQTQAMAPIPRGNSLYD